MTARILRFMPTWKPRPALLTWLYNLPSYQADKGGMPRGGQ